MIEIETNSWETSILRFSFSNSGYIKNLKKGKTFRNKRSRSRLSKNG